MTDNIEEKVKTNIVRYGLVAKGEKVLVGVSGGPDSMALLNILHKFSREFDYELAVATFDHMIRKESSSEVNFVEEFTKRLGIRFFKGKANVKSISKKTNSSLEETARRERLNFLFKIKTDENFDKIALGHNYDDLVETMLINIFKGCGISGLASIKPSSFNDLIHPIINLKRKQIENYLIKNKIPYIIDISNYSLDYLRNKIRHQLIPFIYSIFPEAETQLFNLSIIAGAENDFLETISKKECEMLKQDGSFSLLRIRKIPLALQRRVVREILGEKTNFKRVERVIDFLFSNRRRFNVFGDISIEKDSSDFWLTEKTPFSLENEIIINTPGETYIKEAEIKLKSYITPKMPSVNNFKIALDLNSLKLPLRIRFRKEGDRISLENGSKKIQDLFTDLKIRRDQRYKVPIVVDSDDTIIWVVGVRRSNLYKVIKGTNNKLVLEANFNKK